MRGVVDVSDNTKPSSYQYASRSELTRSSGSIYDLTDDVTDEQFDTALSEAKAEGNLSRANVVRKIKGVKQDGLLHRSQIPQGTTLSVGDVLTVEIRGIEIERGRISLGWV